MARPARMCGWPIALAIVLLLAGRLHAAPLAVSHVQNTQALPPFAVFEITFTHERTYTDPFFDVRIDVTFTAPSARQFAVGGFHYGSEEPVEVRVLEPAPGGHASRKEYVRRKADTWKARFAPAELGRWTYRYVFRNSSGDEAVGQGSFACVPGRVPRHGFVRQHPRNPFRWVFDDGTPFFPVGLQECVGDGHGTGSALDGMALEGPFRTDRTNLVELPPGPLYVRGPSMNPQNADVYFRRYARCGFDLFRFSQNNCSYELYDDLDHYRVQEGIMTDELLRHARKYGFRVMYGLFGYQKVFNQEPQNAEGMAKVRRFIKYSVDRWGAYADFWEFLNEQKAADEWYARMVPYLRSLDPYGHPITTSWERPELDGIEINAPHWYARENELRSDVETANRARGWKQHGKPVIVGEQGNYVDPKKPRPAGVGGVWDEGSARRMRIRLWTAFFNEIGFVFWSTSYARDGHFMNIWLGPREREYVAALQDFCYCLDADVRPVEVKVSAPEEVRAYALASPERAAVYLHHYTSHTAPVEDLTVELDVPREGKLWFYSPVTAEVLGPFDVAAGPQRLRVPPFKVDAAILISPDTAPDLDRDGLINNADEDDDSDGVPDEQDAFPLEPEEWADADHDLIGDNLDADIDGDGLGDDRNRNGVPDYEEMDFNGDGVPRAKAVPWDAFPLDPDEQRDTDGDGVGDNADADDDGDGWSDAEEAAAGTDPLDPLSFPPQ